MNRTIVSKSQNGEDLKIMELLPEDAEPWFIDVGANDGYSWSNSYPFGEIGFSLILIEPIPWMADSCRRHWVASTKVFVEQAAITETAGTADFFITQDPDTDLLNMGSSLIQDQASKHKPPIKVTVITKPLSQILVAYNVPKKYAVLSVDAEGADMAVLKGANLDVYRPRVICVEDGMVVHETKPFLESHGYQMLERLGPNGIYIPVRD